MDAEKVKEIVFEVLDSHISILECGNEERLLEEYKGRLSVYRDLVNEIKASLAEAEAAEQEGWKGLPLCNEERGKLVAKAIDPCTWYNPGFCTYHRQDSELIVSRCACLTENPAEDSEPIAKEIYGKAYYEGLFKFWKKQAEIYMRETIHLKKRAQKEPPPESRANARDRLEGMIERLEERVKILEAADSLDDARLGKLEATDTAFSDTLKGYLERLDGMDIKIDGVIEEMDNRISGVYEHITATRRDIEREQADDQLEEAERETRES